MIERPSENSATPFTQSPVQPLPEAPVGPVGPVGPPVGGRSNGGRPDRLRRAVRGSTLAVVAVLTVLGAAGGAVFALRASVGYQAHAYVLVSAPPTVADNGSAVGLAHAYARVALQPAVVGKALAARGVPPSADYARRGLSVVTSPDAPIIELVGQAPTATGATLLADTASRAFVGYVGQIGRDTGYRLTLLSPAASAQAVGSAGLGLSVAVGAPAGAVLGLGWRLLRVGG